MHSKFIKTAVGLILYSGFYTSVSTVLVSLGSKIPVNEPNRHPTSPKHYSKMFNLGNFDDNKFLSGELTLSKSELTTDATYKLVVGSQMTTGAIWFCADIYAGSEYKFNNHNYGDLRMALTTDYKTNLATNGLVKHNFKVDPFRELEDLSQVDKGMAGFPERLYTFLTVSKDVKPGDYVVLFAYGRTFSDDLPRRFKEFRVKVV